MVCSLTAIEPPLSACYTPHCTLCHWCGAWAVVWIKKNKWCTGKHNNVYHLHLIFPGKIMLQATRICLQQGVCRQMSATIASSARYQWSTAALSTTMHRSYPTACLHTHRRLHQDMSTTTGGEGPGGGGGPESRPIPEQHSKSVDDVLADIGLGQSLG